MDFASFLATGLQQLKQTQATAIHPTTLPAEVALQTGFQGTIPFATLNGRQLQSQRNPEREAASLAEKLSETTPDVVILFSASLGALLQDLIKRLPDTSFLIYEPSFAIFYQLLEHGKLHGLCSHPRSAWFAPGLAEIDALMRKLQELQASRPLLHCSTAHLQAFPDEAAALQTAFKSYQHRKSVNVQTLKRFGPLWTRNLLRNRDQFATAPGLDQYAGRFQGIPALLVAGGPSLDAVTPELARYRESHLIVAVDTSLSACLRAGVDPDFVVTVDPQYWNTRHLDGCAQSQAIVMSEPSVYSRGLRATKGPFLLSGSIFPLGKLMEGDTIKRTVLGAGGSVATSAWDFCRRLGVSRIIMAGLDLSFPDGKTHFHGSFFEEATHRNATRLTPASHERFRYLHDGYAFSCETPNGASVLSDHRMDLYVHWFEQQMQLHPDCPTFRIRAAHRTIRGVPAIDASESLAAPSRRAAISAILQACQPGLSSDLTSATASKEAVDQRLQGFALALKDLHTVTTRAITACTTWLAKPTDQTTTILATLDQTDAYIANSANSRIIGFLMEEAIQSVQKLSPPANFQESIQRSLNLYEDLLRSVETYTALFARFIH